MRCSRTAAACPAGPRRTDERSDTGRPRRRSRLAIGEPASPAGPARFADTHRETPTMADDLVVVKLDRARMLLAEVRDAGQAKQVADLAHAARVLAQRQRLSQQVIRQAREIEIDALTLLGEHLQA